MRAQLKGELLSGLGLPSLALHPTRVHHADACAATAKFCDATTDDELPVRHEQLDFNNSYRELRPEDKDSRRTGE
jgi:hypothetical protein